MIKKISKSEANKQIREFFSNIKYKNPKEVKKMKKIAMNQNIKIGGKRKLFCKMCLIPYENSKIRIKNKTKIITCENCKHVSRWKVKSNSS